MDYPRAVSKWRLHRCMWLQLPAIQFFDHYQSPMFGCEGACLSNALPTPQNWQMIHRGLVCLLRWTGLSCSCHKPEGGSIYQPVFKPRKLLLPVTLSSTWLKTWIKQLHQVPMLEGHWAVSTLGAWKNIRFKMIFHWQPVLHLCCL